MSLTFDQDDLAYPQLRKDDQASTRLWGSVRYLGVLAVWLGLLAVRPRLAIDIYRNRRADSPLRRR